MELGKQIKKYRAEVNLSQEELADQIFVSRQTISNWENDKNYPDIKSLVLMSEVFRTTRNAMEVVWNGTVSMFVWNRHVFCCQN